MRMTELRCPACGGDLKIDKNNPNIAVCDYCNTQFFLEKETGFLNPEGKYVAKESPNRGSGRKADGQKRLAAGGLLGTALLVLVCGMRIYLRWERVNERARDAMRQQSAKNWEIQERNLNSALEEQLTDRMPGVYVEGYGAESGEQPLTGAFGETAERIFEKPADEITEKELAQIKWLETERDMDYLYVGYSLADPYGEDGAELTWLTFPDDTEAGVSCLFRFTGLRKVDLYQHIGAEDIRGLDLAGIGGYFGSLPELAGMLENPAGLQELHIMGSMDSLGGLEKFGGLQVLRLDRAEGLGLEQLVRLPELRSLSLECDDASCDLSVLGVLGGLEELYVEADGLKSLEFLKGMEGLKKLEIVDAGILSLDGLAGMDSLTSLRVWNCDKLKSMELPGELAGVKELALELPYDCTPPDLTGFRQVEVLKLSGFKDCSFLGDMANLTSLTLESCQIGSGTELTGLVNLEELTCSAFMQPGQPLGFVADFPALKKVDVSGMSTYDDISGIFNIRGLVCLDISGMGCEIDFDRIGDNPSLEVLRMDGIRLYENVRTGGSDGFYWADWDDVVLDGHTDFLKHFPGLKELGMAENELTDLGFASNLPQLEILDIAGNYVTDLRPLAGIAPLRLVDCTDNPISNERVLGDGVVIVTDGGTETGF